MSRGVVILSLGHPYYIRMAYQLAFSIKCNEADVKICLIQNNVSFLNESQKKVFDNIIEMPAEIIADKKFIKAKTYIYDLSPFDETIYLDADMLWLNKNKLSSLFEELKGVDITFACRGVTNMEAVTEKTSIWGNLLEVKEKLNIKEGLWYQLSSEFIYFKKSERIKKYFETAQQLYIDTHGIDFKTFANTIADEFAFGISGLINNVYPHKEKYTPIYWAHAEKRRVKVIDPFINDNYYGYSMGGAYATQQQRGYYDNMLSWYQQKHGKIDVFPAQSKSRYLENRKTI